MIARSLLPDSADFSDGLLRIGGVDVARAASTYGTPLQVYDELHLRERCRQLVAAFPGGAAYASKAFLCRAMARLAYDEGMQIDVASSGEMAVAVAAGVPASQLVLHGNNKSEAELAEALRLRIHRIVIDSWHEIERLRVLLRDGAHRAPDVLLRINPAVLVDTHASVSTGQADSKFGFPQPTGEAAAAVAELRQDKVFRLRGLHVHVGSQLASLDAIRAGVRAVASLAAQADVSELSVGGGLGVAQTSTDRAPTIAEWARAVRQAVDAAGFTGTVTAEPGRSVVALAGVSIYRVGTIKAVPSGRQFVSVDGGLSDNPRPALYGSRYEPFLLRQSAATSDGIVADIVGKNCESGDTLVRDARLPGDIAVGDLLCIPVTGAYVHAMSSNYNKLPRPPVIFAADGHDRLVIRRETPQDLLATDVFELQPPEPETATPTCAKTTASAADTSAVHPPRPSW